MEPGPPAYKGPPRPALYVAFSIIWLVWASPWFCILSLACAIWPYDIADVSDAGPNDKVSIVVVPPRPRVSSCISYSVLPIVVADVNLV